MNWLDVALFPACALVAIAGTALVIPADDADDRSLIQSFMVFFGLSLLLALGVLQTESVQRQLNPQLAKQHALASHPIQQTIQSVHADKDGRLAARIAVTESKGIGLNDAFIASRSILESMALDYLGFASDAERIAWGRVSMQALEELRARDPKLCFARIVRQREGLDALDSGMSGSNSASFQEAFIGVLKSGYANMGSRSGSGSQGPDFNELQRRYSEIMAPLERKYGAATMRFLGRHRFETMSAEGIESSVCSARIEQLAVALAEPQAMASRIVDSLLR